MTKEDQIETILATIVKYEQEDLTTMKTTLILSIDRRDSPEDAMRTVELAIRYKKLGVVGVDLCGDPFKGDIYTFRHPFAKAKEAGLGLTIHFAEASLTSSDEELLTLLSYQPDRLGHCIHASDIVKREIIRRKITLELCISCNVQIRLDPKVAHHHDHHFGEWWKSKACPIALCVSSLGGLLVMAWCALLTGWVD